MSDILNPYELSEGQTVVLVWEPYQWAREQFNHTSEMSAEVTYLSGTPKKGHMFDVSLDADGTKMTVHIDNGYVTTGQGGSPFDKGRFRYFREKE